MVNVSLRKRRRENESNNDDGSDQEYQVEAIVDKRVRGKKIQYLLKWQGYPNSDNTWEDVNRLNCPELIKQFEDRLNSKNKPGKSSTRNRSSSSTITKSKNTNMNETDEDYQSDVDGSMDTGNDTDSTKNDETAQMATRNSPRKKTNSTITINDSLPLFRRRHSTRKIANQTKSRITTMSKDQSSDDDNDDQVGDIIEEISSSTRKSNKNLPTTPKRKKTSNENAITISNDDTNRNIISPLKTPTKDSCANEPATINLCLHISPSSSSSISLTLNDNDKNNNTHGKTSADMPTAELDADETDQVEKIEAVRHNQDGISFRIKLAGENRSQWISAKIANRKYPQAVIAFWENHVQFI